MAPARVYVCRMPILTSAERGGLLACLTQSQANLRAATEPLTEAQWTHAPAPRKWSPVELVEHLVLTETAVPRIIAMALEEPVWSYDPAEAAVRDREIAASMQDDTNRMTAPEAATPRRRFETGQAAVDAFHAQRNRTLAYVRETDDALRDHRFPHPAYGPIDGYQWLLMLAHHADRHVRQISRAIGGSA